jgi:hypothetical protein
LETNELLLIDEAVTSAERSLLLSVEAQVTLQDVISFACVEMHGQMLIEASRVSMRHEIQHVT